jgi:hypothetical protein
MGRRRHKNGRAPPNDEASVKLVTKITGFYTDLEMMDSLVSRPSYISMYSTYLRDRG